MTPRRVRLKGSTATHSVYRELADDYYLVHYPTGRIWYVRKDAVEVVE